MRPISKASAVWFAAGAIAALAVSRLSSTLPGHARPALASAVRAGALATAQSDQAALPVHRCGRIEAIEIPLATPDGTFPDREQRLAQPKWFFENFSESQLTRFVNNCSLRPTEQRALLDKRNWEITTMGIAISPSEQLLWSLSPQSRAQIYSVLGRSRTNFPQSYPFRFPLAGLEERFKRSDLPFESIEKIKRLSYTEGGYLCFTDLQAMKTALTEDQFNELVATLYQVPAYMLRLHVFPDSDVEGLISYWGRGGREKLIAPLMNSLAKVPGGSAMNVSYFLPSFARLRLYTYPYTWNDPSAHKQDCFFTSLNFFNSPANTNFYDRAYTARVLEREYVPVSGEPLFGDIVALSNGANETVHTCVYIADDFVFTKNGVDAEQPWVLMKLPDMVMLYYATDRTGHISFLRRRDMS